MEPCEAVPALAADVVERLVDESTTPLGLPLRLADESTARRIAILFDGATELNDDRPLAAS